MARVDTAPVSRPVWTMEVEQLVEQFETDPETGLGDEEAARRLLADGPNELPASAPPPWWRRLLGHLADPVVYLLMAATAVSVAAWMIEGADGLPFDAIAIIVIVIANATIGYLQERKAEAAMDALRALTRNEATVIRSGVTSRLSAVELVPGDVVLLTAGDIVPADARLVEVVAVQAAEATLTGESAPVLKSADPTPAETPLGDRSAMVHSGTIVVTGRGKAVVTATGTDTEVGRIADLLGTTESEPTPLQSEIAHVGRVLGGLVVAIAVVVVITIVVLDGVRTGSDLVEALLIGVSLAVAAVPEGLPAVLSVVLAIGVQRMSRRNALVKRLVSVEALGSATVICSDKTGTLTRNEMMVRTLVVPSGELTFAGSGYDPGIGFESSGIEPDDRNALGEARWALAVADLASDASIRLDDDRWIAVGDPTEAALMTARAKLGVDESSDVVDHLRRTNEIPFSSERRLMSTINVDGDRMSILAVKGAPDRVVGRCRWEYRGGRPSPLDAGRRQWWNERFEALADEGLRTLALAHRTLGDEEAITNQSPPPVGLAEIERDLVLCGVVGIIDPPRLEARDSIALANQAGIRVIMITGDHPGTARRIATEVGIIDGGGAVVTGRQMATVGGSALNDMVHSTSVFARVAPEQKLTIVQALLAQGEVVAVTGDGVNDAPALRAASIGVAMGVTGSDVSKETADMILADDNIATIVAAVHEGRTIFHNIRSFLRYLLSSNIGEVLTVFLGVVGAGLIGLTDAASDGVAAPLLAVQILWINLVTDTGPALALGVDPPSDDLMNRPPRDLGRRIIDRRMQLGIGIIGTTMALASLVMLDLKLPGGLLGGPYWGSGDLVTARTGAFTVLVLLQLVNTVNARSEVESIRGRFLINPLLFAACALSLGLQVAVVHVPWLQKPFGTAALGPTDWLVACLLALSVTVVSEIRKLVLRRLDGGGGDEPSVVGLST